VPKIDLVKEALKDFIAGLKDTTVVGLFTFSSEAKELVGFGEYKDVRSRLDSAVNGLQPERATYMKDGLQLVQQKISIARAEEKFKDKQFSLVFISDGVPEINECDPSHGPCGGDRNYDITQDPTIKDEETETSLVERIRQSGVTIYSIGIYNDDDLVVTGKLREIINSIATPGNADYQNLPAGRQDWLAHEGSLNCLAR
jgi:hypothetical protein